MTPKQFVDIVSEIADKYGFTFSTDWNDGDEWSRDMKPKGCTIFSGDFNEPDASTDDYKLANKKMNEIRYELWEGYLIIGNNPIENGKWEDGCILNVDFRNNRHHWSKPGEKAFQVMEIDANLVCELSEEELESHYYPAYDSYFVFKNKEEAENAAETLHRIHGTLHRIDEIELDDELDWVYLDLLHKLPRV